MLKPPQLTANSLTLSKAKSKLSKQLVERYDEEFKLKLIRFRTQHKLSLRSARLFNIVQHELTNHVEAATVKT